MSRRQRLHAGSTTMLGPSADRYLTGRKEFTGRQEFTDPGEFVTFQDARCPVCGRDFEGHVSAELEHCKAVYGATL